MACEDVICFFTFSYGLFVNNYVADKHKHGNHFHSTHVYFLNLHHLLFIHGFKKNISENIQTLLLLYCLFRSPPPFFFFKQPQQKVWELQTWTLKVRRGHHINHYGQMTSQFPVKREHQQKIHKTPWNRVQLSLAPSQKAGLSLPLLSVPTNRSNLKNKVGAHTLRNQDSLNFPKLRCTFTNSERDAQIR